MDYATRMVLSDTDPDAAAENAPAEGSAVPSAKVAKGQTGVEQRAEPRFISLIRAAKLLTNEGEFVCVIRDVSRSGVKVRTFHELPKTDGMTTLELQNGDHYRMERVRLEPGEASFTFAEKVEVEHLIKEEWHFPRRQLRLTLEMPVVVTTRGQRIDATVSNISQQGAQLKCDALFALDQQLYVSGDHLPEIRAKIRWREAGSYGLAFEDTFSLAQFAKMAARVQCPQLAGLDS